MLVDVIAVGMVEVAVVQVVDVIVMANRGMAAILAVLVFVSFVYVVIAHRCLAFLGKLDRWSTLRGRAREVQNERAKLVLILKRGPCDAPPTS